MVSMAATLGVTMRSPFTGVIFALELTHDYGMMLPVFVAVIASYAFTVLVMKRSILTEKVARRGFHLSREYTVDPLEILFVREVMRTGFDTLPLNPSREEMSRFKEPGPHSMQRLFPVVDASSRLAGVVAHKQLQDYVSDPARDHSAAGFRSLVKLDPVSVFPDETLRAAVNRMAESGVTRLLVVDRHDPKSLVGIISLSGLLRARVRNLEEERNRQRFLKPRYLFRPEGVGPDIPDPGAASSVSDRKN